MLADITLHTSFAFALIYPLCLWLSFKDPLKNNFHHFHTATPNIIGGVVLVFILRGAYAPELKILTGVWFALSFLVTCFYWRKETVNVRALSAASILGAWAYFLLLDRSLLAFGVSLLANAIFCVSLFAMNLGHWYLNVHGLPIVHLKRAAFSLWILIAGRAVWDFIYLLRGQIIFDGERIPLYSFLMKTEGIFILVGLAFGLILPLTTLWMVKEILKLKNTQATTGMLYVILCSVIFADLAFKYYFLKYGILM